MSQTVNVLDQLHDLHPICTARKQSLGWRECGNPATTVAHLHAWDHCNEPGLTADGDLVETLCDQCLAAVRRQVFQFVHKHAQLAAVFNAYPMCMTCGRGKMYLHAAMQIKLLGASS